MKRVAENQLTKDDYDNYEDDGDDDVQEVNQPSEGFQRPDESVLSKRQIRALPKRALGGSAPKAASFNGFTPTSTTLASSADKDTPGPPKFAGFAGFGAGSSATSNPFTFSVQPPTTSVDSISMSGPASSYGGFKPQSISIPIHPGSSFDDASSTPDTTKPTRRDGMDAAALKYYKSLRGLNVSFLSAISKAIEQDPFIDVVGILESYKNLRTSVQSEFDNASNLGTAPSSTSGSSSIFGSTATMDKATPTPQFAMPKPPTAFSAFSTTPSTSVKPSSASDSAFTFGATPPVKPSRFPPQSSSSTLAPFSLAPKTNEPSSSSVLALEPPKSAFSFGGSRSGDTSSSTTSPFSFIATASTQSSESSVNASETVSATTGPSSLPVLGSSAFGSNSSVPNFFTSSKTSNTSTDTPVKTAIAFGTSSSVFGDSGDSGKLSLFALPTTSNAVAAGDILDSSNQPARSLGMNLFGGDKSVISGGSAFLAERPLSLLGAGSQKPAAFSFGKPAGSIGNPVGFVFGAPKASDSSSVGVSEPPPPGDTLSPQPTEKSGESTPQPEDIEDSATTEDAAKLLPTGSHDEEGEGEEEEETMHAVRCKVFKFTKTGDNQEWKDLGIGMFRLKKHKETNIRRVLMRNSNTGRILINFRLYAGLKLSLAKAALTFVGHDNGVPASYRMRVKTEEQASQLKAAMDGEIAAIQPSSP